MVVSTSTEVMVTSVVAVSVGMGNGMGIGGKVVIGISEEVEHSLVVDSVVDVLQSEESCLLSMAAPLAAPSKARRKKVFLNNILINVLM